ncbi:MAG: hypothetical protein V8R80_07105 [Eubacterium sp.]
MALYGWLLVAITAASPILDSSFVEKGIFDRDVFTGMASVRCSEMDTGTILLRFLIMKILILM